MWTDYSVMDRFETGRVYVVYQDKQVPALWTIVIITIFVAQHRFRNFDTLTGETHKARFGISVASLGDINLDGFQGSSLKIMIWRGEDHDRIIIIILDWPDFEGQLLLISMHHGLTTTQSCNLSSSSSSSDLAVGAPYGGREGRGAVYVFLGSREGVVKKPSQVTFHQINYVRCGS